MNRYSDSTLKGMTKDELIRYVRMCEYNQDVAEANLAQQYDNFKTIVKDWEIKKHGKWEEYEDKSAESVYGHAYYGVRCSCCKTDFARENLTKHFNSKYCPYCGAKMDEED